MKSNEIISRRDAISKEITKYWGIIRAENLVEKSYKRNYDLKVLLKKIEDLAAERTNMKLYQQCINMGYTSLSQFPANSLFPTIFELSEVNERFVQLGLIKTLDPKLKSKKGKVNLNKSEELTSQYITNLQNALKLRTIELKKKIDEYNNTADLDISKPLMLLVA